MSSELANALGAPMTTPLTEDSKYDDPPDVKDDLDMDDDVKPPTDGEGAHAPHGDDEMEDLFGDDKDAEEVRHDGATTPASSEHLDGISSPARRHREALEYAEEDEPDQPMEEEVLEAIAQIPNIPVPRSSDGNHWVFRIPNFVRVDSKPFHPDTYVGPEHEDEDGHVESARDKGMSIKLKVENTLRWRWTKDEHGQDRRQSNSRIIRWSDGTLSLKLGKELFDVTQTIDISGAVPRQAIGGSQGSQPIRPTQPATKAQGLTYLVAQHKRAEILQCEAMITGTMTLRPTGMQSEAHRMLARAVGQKHTKQARLRLAPDPTMDPEREKMELLKKVSKKTRKPRGEDDGLGGGRRRRTGYSRKRSGDDMWSDDEDEDVFEGGSDEEFGRAGPSAKRRKPGDADAKRGPGEYQADDFVVADEDDEDEDAESDDGRGRRHKKRKASDEEGGDDHLDRLDAKIEADERKRRQQETVGGVGDSSTKDVQDDAMDVESEEDDDFNVKNVPKRGRKKVVALEEDEEEE